MVMLVGMTMVVVVAVSIAQQPGGEEVDRKTKHPDRNSFPIGNRYGVDQPDYAFVSHLNGDHRQDDDACKGGEVAELAGAKAETRTLGMLARKQIGQPGDPER